MKEKNFFHIKNKKVLAECFVVGFLLISSLITIVLPVASASHATIDILGDAQSYDTALSITVTDPTAIGAGSVVVTVTTTSDPVGIPLTLIETSPGIFDNINPSTLAGTLWLMNGNNKFPLGTTVEMNYEDDPFFYDPSFPDTVPIFFTTSNVFNEYDITETGDATAIFKGLLTFGPTASPNSNLADITPGEIFHLTPPCGSKAHGQITPIPDPNTEGAILANVGDTITATYEDSSHTDTAFLNSAGGGCGGSGGGLVISRVVLDVLAGTGTTGDFTPPLLALSKLKLSTLPLIGDILETILNADPFTPIMPLDDPSIDYPITINGNGYLLTQYANTIQTYTGKTGVPISFKMTLFDATGVEHIGLYTNLRDDAREVQDSDTYVIYNEGKPLEITDPHGFFSNVNFTESESNGKYITDFNMTFAKPMNTSDLIIRTWDEKKNSGDIKIFNAIKIEGEPIINPTTNNLFVPESTEIFIPYYKLPYYEIPNADSEGKLIYYNSFGVLEEKQVHPYYTPIVYPDDIGKAERHDDGFYESAITEKIKSQKIADEIIGNPFKITEDNSEHLKFVYPNNVGKLDREDKGLQKDIMMQEQIKATKIFNKLYRTNHVED